MRCFHALYRRRPTVAANIGHVRSVDRPTNWGEVGLVYRPNVHTTYGTVGADVREHPVALFPAEVAAPALLEIPNQGKRVSVCQARPPFSGVEPTRTPRPTSRSLCPSAGPEPLIELRHRVVKLARKSRDDLDGDFIQGSARASRCDSQGCRSSRSPSRRTRALRRRVRSSDDDASAGRPARISRSELRLTDAGTTPR